MINKNKYLKRRIILTIIISISISMFVLPIIDALVNMMFGSFFNIRGSVVLFLASIIFYFIKDNRFIGKYFNLEIEIINKKQCLKRLVIAFAIAVFINVVLSPFINYLVNIGRFYISAGVSFLCLASIVFYFIDDNNVKGIHSEEEHNLENKIKNEKSFLEHLLIAILMAFCISVVCATLAFSLVTGMYADLFNFYLTIGVFFGGIVFYFIYIFFRSIHKLKWLFGSIVAYVFFIAIANWLF